MGKDIFKNLQDIFAATCYATASAIGLERRRKGRIKEKLKKNSGKEKFVEGVGMRQEISEDARVNANKFVQSHQKLCNQILTN